MTVRHFCQGGTSAPAVAIYAPLQDTCYYQGASACPTRQSGASAALPNSHLHMRPAQHLQYTKPHCQHTCSQVSRRGLGASSVSSTGATVQSSTRQRLKGRPSISPTWTVLRAGLTHLDKLCVDPGREDCVLLKVRSNGCKVQRIHLQANTGTFERTSRQNQQAAAWRYHASRNAQGRQGPP